MEAYLHILDLLTVNAGLRLYCTDLSNIGALDREQEVWLNLEYYPMVHNLLQSDFYVAVVFSEEHFKAIVTNYQASAPAELYAFTHFTYFTAVDEAIHWLMSIKKGQDTALLPAAL
ncbi:hypothetical protein [Pontibacter chitinilyticus]|uniref:hypothetical protein n=1 Tax=Pontibacter chitinilyticus TaxID=2674989 RepID=UPI00321B2748